MLVSIYGEHLGPLTSCKGERRPGTWDFPTGLCKTQVLLRDVPVGLLYVHEKQINFMVPENFPEGPADIRVVYQGTLSQPVSLEVRVLSLDEPAYVHMPVWIRVELNYVPGVSIQYPCTDLPWEFTPWGSAENELRVRRNGNLLPKIALPTPSGIRSGAGCWIPGPRQSENERRIPLHLWYRFDEPGVYEVQYTAYREAGPNRGEVLYQSTWTKIEVFPFAVAQRQEWLRMRKESAPTDAPELLSDFLPSILAYADEQVFSILLQYIHHPDHSVQEYVTNSLRGYYPDKAIPGAETVP